MRHSVFGWRLSRDINARKALLANLASSLMENGKITTTLAKAKFVRAYVEKLVTSAKSDKLSTRRNIAAKITNQAFKKLISEIGPGFSARPGGYTRIIKLEQRGGDAAPMARLEFVQMEKVEPKSIKQASATNTNAPKSSSRKSTINPRKSKKAK